METAHLNQTRQNASIMLQFRLFDPTNNQTIHHTTYEIVLTKGTSTSINEKPVLRDLFHTHTGLLTLKIKLTTTNNTPSSTSSSLTIYGDRDPFENAIVADPSGTVLIKGPISLLDEAGGLYHIHVEIFRIYNDTSIIVPENAPTFDGYLSIGIVYPNILHYQNQNYNTTLISYYDKIKAFNFDPAKKNISWSMPFNYNLTRLIQQPTFVHEEFILAKNAWRDILGGRSNSSLNATVNGKLLKEPRGSFTIDSSRNVLSIHYLIDKNNIIKLAEEEANNKDKHRTITYKA